jgi:hypothetical protein
MTTVELERQARAIVPPIGASVAIAIHDGTHHRAAFLVNERTRSAPVGPTFTKPREACDFVRLLNGDRPATRPGVRDSAGALGGADRGDAGRQPESPEMGADGFPSSAPASLPRLAGAPALDTGPLGL